MTVTKEQYLEATKTIQLYHSQSQQLIIMPSLQDFKPRRKLLGKSLREVANNTGVSAATISRIERGNNADYNSVKAIHEYYVKNQV